MKVLYIGHTYSIKANQDKISALAEHPDLQLLLLTPSEWKGPLYDHKSDVYPESDRVEHRALPALFTGKESLYIFRQGLRKIVKDFQPDILHVEQGTYAAVFGQAILACSHAAPNAKATFFTWWNLPTPIRGVKKVLEHFNLRRSACAIAGNHDAKTLLEGKGFDRPIFVMPQIGVSLSDYAQPADTALREQLRLKKFVVGYIGRIAEEKGIADLVASMAGRRDWSLLTVGSGPIEYRLSPMAERYDVDLKHIPSVRNEEIPKYLKLLDALVLPSRKTPLWMEQFGHILIEAMAAGIPVIGARTGEIPNVIGDAGLLVSPESPNEIRSALEEVASDPGTRSSLAAKGLDRVTKLYTHRQIANQQIDVYEWMMKEGMSVQQLASR